MTNETLASVLAKHGLNVKKAAALFCVSERAVYQWLDGTRRIPEIAVELARLKLGEPL